MNLANRRVHVSEDIETDHGTITICVGWDKPAGCGGQVVEVFFTGRPKSGTGLERLLYDLGVAVSKIAQHKPVSHGRGAPEDAPPE